MKMVNITEVVANGKREPAVTTERISDCYMVLQPMWKLHKYWQKTITRNDYEQLLQKMPSA